ncbi:MAG: HXXEE domain-containing protein [Terracidiphilus sp.]|nr:HXXEE domain-containing protein [Terracidiphilus sp.]
MTFRTLQLLFPVLVALHNTEEAIGLPRWTRRSGPWFGGVQPAVFRFAVVVFTVLAFVVTVLSAVSGKMTFWGNLTFGYIVAMLFNALVPHIAVSVVRRTLMPGVITAAALNLPILSFLAVLALKQGYVSNHDALVFSIAVPLLLALMIPLLFNLGKSLGL